MPYRFAALIAVVLLFAPLGGRAAEGPNTIALASMSIGQTIEVQTQDRYFRFRMINPQSGEALAQASWNGKDYSAERLVYVLGCSHGNQARSGGLSLVFMNELKTGLRLELGMGSLNQHDRRLTQPIKSMRTLPDSNALALN